MSDAPPPPPPPPPPPGGLDLGTSNAAPRNAAPKGMLAEIEGFSKMKLSHAVTKDMSGPKTCKIDVIFDTSYENVRQLVMKRLCIGVMIFFFPCLSLSFFKILC
jgi:hypothetical protein